MINPGRLNKRILIFKEDPTATDDYGEPTNTPIEVHKCWASVKNKSGKEQFQANTPFAKTITSFLIRYTKKTIDTTMKIDFKGEKYNIIYVDNYNFSNEYIEITAELVK